MVDNDCIFCKIANGEIPSYTLYEDDKFRVIMDIGPASKGHAILLPKEHFENIFSLSDDYAGHALIVAKKVASAMQKVSNCDGFNILQNNGELAGQTVFHFHIHLIPRYNNDTVNIKWNPGSVNEDEAKSFASEVQKFCARS